VVGEPGSHERDRILLSTGIRCGALRTLWQNRPTRRWSLPFVLARDPSPQVRAQAANMAFCLTPDAFAVIIPVLVPMHADESLDVQSTVAIFFAERNDGISAKAIYDLLLREDHLEAWRQSNIVQAMNNLTGS
jgi:hypothetical protein